MSTLLDLTGTEGSVNDFVLFQTFPILLHHKVSRLCVYFYLSTCIPLTSTPPLPPEYEDFLTVVEKQFYQEGAPLSPLTIMDSVNDSHRNLRTLFEEIRRYVSLLSENDEISDEVYAVMGPQDILPVTNSTKLLKTNVICSLNSMKLQKLLKSIPEDTCKMSLTSDNTTCSDNCLKYFKFPVLALQG